MGSHYMRLLAFEALRWLAAAPFSPSSLWRRKRWPAESPRPFSHTALVQLVVGALVAGGVVAGGLAAGALAGGLGTSVSVSGISPQNFAM